MTSTGLATRRLLLVRHGLPDYRGGGSQDDPPGPPLSEIGFAQVRQSAGVVRACAPRTVYSSPLARTEQTARCLGNLIGRPVQIDSELREWHRTERLYEVSVRVTRWLARWLGGSEPTAAVVSHASPLLAMLRSALYLPHVGWHRPGCPAHLEVSGLDRLEVSMASVFELVIESKRVMARRLFHPSPRILHVDQGVHIERPGRPVVGDGENAGLCRPNRLHWLGG